MKTVETDNEKKLFIIKFRIKDSTEWFITKDIVKSLVGRDFHPNTRYWTAPIIKENAVILKGAGFEFLNGYPFSEDNSKVEKEIPWKDIEINKSIIPGLRPYQYDCMKFLTHVEGRGLIADDMGTGKTVQSLSYAKLIGFDKPMLIVVPSGVKIQWYREFRKWFSKSANIEILNGQTSHELSPNTSYIINWDILVYWCATIERWVTTNADGEEEKHKKIHWDGPLLDINFGLIIGDECHNIGNSKSDRTKAFKRIAKKTKMVLPMSGTPIESGPHQFFPVLNILSPELFPNEWKFKMRYCDPKSNGFGFVFKGSSNEEELHSLISPLMIRRTKDEILPDLPKKTIIPVPLDDVNLSNYLKMEKKLSGQFQITKSKTRIKALFDDLKWSAFEAKKNSVIKWIEMFIASGEKLVVGTFHRKVSEFIYESFKEKSVLVYGGISATKKDKAKLDFIEKKHIKLFVGNIISAGVGTDGLQKVCSNSATVEYCWTPTKHNQFDDRLHRFGQKSATNCYYFIAPNTVEEDIIKILDKKAKMLGKVIDGKKEEDIDILEDLLKERGVI